MNSAQQGHRRPGISAVVVTSDQPKSAVNRDVLDVAAVLEGLVQANFEVLLVGTSPTASDLIGELRASAPALPVRCVEADNAADAFDVAEYELVFIAAADGRFDVCELNHVLDAIEAGADAAAGYRPRRTDAIVRRLQRWGCNLEVDCAFTLFHRTVWQAIVARSDGCPTTGDLLVRARRLGFRVAEVPVSHRRPALAEAVASSRAA